MKCFGCNWITVTELDWITVNVTDICFICVWVSLSECMYLCFFCVLCAYVYGCLCVYFTVRLGGDPQRSGALSWPNIIVSHHSESVALLWFKVGHRQFQRLRL